MTERITVEGHEFVTNGSTTCPHPDWCDRGEGESYEGYVIRHALDHGLGDEWTEFADAERNLAIHCFYYFNRHIIDNRSIVPHPCWEDAEYLSNWSFAAEDLEQDIRWDERHFILKPAADRLPGVPKRMKKLTKVRGTQKTSWARALVTWEHLRAYFIQRNPYFRVLVISATSGLATDHYFEPLKTMWEGQENLQRLFGQTVYTKAGEEREICLLAMRGSRPGTNRIRIRWNVSNKQSSGKSAISFLAAGVDTATTGQRWDLVIFDDPVIDLNCRTHEQRAKVKRKYAELRKQLAANGRLVWLNTPWHLEDASQQIDDEYGDEFHILYRPALHVDPVTHEEVFYWEYDGLREPVWTRERIAIESRQPDFSSQVLLRPRDAKNALFDDTDFVLTRLEECPLEVRAGIGAPLSDADESVLARDHVRIRSYLFVDPSGKEQQTVTGDDTAIVGWRVDRFGNLFVVQLRSGQWTSTREKEEIFAAWVQMSADLIEYELPAQPKDTGYAWQRWQEEKGRELGRPLSMPMQFVPIRRNIVKSKRIEDLHTFAKSGKIRIVTDCVDDIERKKFVSQFVNYLATAHDDYPDAASRILKYVALPSLKERRAMAEPEPFGPFAPNRIQIGAGTFAAGNRSTSWGRRGAA